MSKNKNSNFIPFGKIVKPHGVKGELKLFLYNKDSKILTNKINIWIEIDNCLIKYKLLSIKGNNSKIVKVDKIDSRDDAEVLSNKEFFILRNDFPEIESDNFYINDIINLKVLVNNKDLGYIYDVFSLPGGNVMGLMYNGREILIPLLDKYIEFFDFDKKIVGLKNIKEFIEL